MSEERAVLPQAEIADEFQQQMVDLLRDAVSVLKGRSVEIPPSLTEYEATH